MRKSVWGSIVSFTLFNQNFSGIFSFRTGFLCSARKERMQETDDGIWDPTTRKINNKRWCDSFIWISFCASSFTKRRRRSGWWILYFGFSPEVWIEVEFNISNFMQRIPEIKEKGERGVEGRIPLFFHDLMHRDLRLYSFHSFLCINIFLTLFLILEISIFSIWTSTTESQHSFLKISPFCVCGDK